MNARLRALVTAPEGVPHVAVGVGAARPAVPPCALKNGFAGVGWACAVPVIWVFGVQGT